MVERSIPQLPTFAKGVSPRSFALQTSKQSLRNALSAGEKTQLWCGEILDAPLGERLADVRLSR